MSKTTKVVANDLAHELSRRGNKLEENGVQISVIRMNSNGFDQMITEKDPNYKFEDLEKYPKSRRKDSGLWRDLTAFWILGLCNNYGYVVMLSAAHDIIEQFNGHVVANDDGTSVSDSGRLCNIVSTGTILLADIVPSLIVKLLAPFIPLWVHARVIIAISLAAIGFLLVAFAESEWMALLGVVSTSLSSGLGETTFLAYSSQFNKNVISTWSSGTGGAGIIGSLSYAALKSIHISPMATMLIMLVFPGIECFAFWVILRKPSQSIIEFGDDLDNTNEMISNSDNEKPLSNLKEKLFYVLSLMKYMIPLMSVYLFEYFINQGLFELIYFKNTFLDKPAQYRWLNVDYQIGVFISRSSVNLFTIDKIWIMSLLQFVNVIYFLFEVIFSITPNIWIIFAAVFWEGLLGGGAYVNTFYRMSKEIPSARKQFAMGIVVQSDTIGIALAGLLAIPVHNAICNLSASVRPYEF